MIKLMNVKQMGQKKSISIMMLVMLVSYHSNAQVTITTPCETNKPLIITNPDSTKVQPQNPSTGRSFEKNTFNWMEGNFQDYHYYTVKNYYHGLLESPYFSNHSLYYGINSDTNSNFYPDDGWELLYKDFGKLKEPRPNDTSQSRFTNSNLNGSIFVLYNRYSGLLRFFGTTPGFSHNLYANLNLSMTNKEDFTEMFSYNYNFSGLFANHNVPHQTMEDTSKITELNLQVILPQYDFLYYYTETQVAYDPCTCNKSSALSTQLKVQEEAGDMVLNGRLGNNNPPNEDMSLHSGILGQKDYRYYYIFNFNQKWNSNKNKQWLTNNQGMLNYPYIRNLGTDMITFAKNKNLNDKIKTDLAHIQKLDTVATNQKDSIKSTFPILQAISNVSDYFANKTHTQESPSVIMSGMKLNINNSNAKYRQSATNYILMNPGSYKSKNAPECCGMNLTQPNIGQPDYPIYNEVLGVFALLEHPKIRRFRDNKIVGKCKDKAYNTELNKYNFREYYQLSKLPQYVFNPATRPNLDKSKISGSLEIWTDVYTYDDADKVNPKLVTKNLIFVRKEGNFNIYRTPFLPLNCMMDFVSSIGIDPICLAPHNEIKQNIKLFLKVIVEAEFLDLNRYGKPNRSNFVMTFPVDVEEVFDDNIKNIMTTSNYIDFPFIIQIDNNTNYPRGTSDIHAWDYVYINKDISTDAGNIINIFAGKGFIIAQNVHIGTGINLIERYPFNCNADTTLTPVGMNDVASFCSSSKYKAYISMKNEDVSYKAPNTIPTTFSLTLMPNPNFGNFTLKYSLSNDEQVNAFIIDMEGRKVCDVITSLQQSAGNYTSSINCSHISAGIYALVFITPTHKEVKRMVVIGR